MRPSYWPFSRRAAFVSSVVLVPVCVAIVIWLGEQESLEFDPNNWAVVIAVALGLTPVILIVLGGVGSVEAAGVKVAFAAVQEVIASVSDVDTRTLLAHNLGQPPGQANDSASDTVIETIGNAVGNDIVVIDLRDGEAWWETRLFLLASGAARLQNPKALAFTTAVPDRPRMFVGWARQADVHRRLLDARPQFWSSAEDADRESLYWRLSATTPEKAQKTLPWAPAGKATVYVPEDGRPPRNAVRREGTNLFELPWPSSDPATPPWVLNEDRFIPERLLLQRLARLETDEHPWKISEGRLRELLGSVLYTNAVDRDESEERWISTIVGSTADYFAVTSQLQLVTLIPRPAALNAVLLSILHGSRGSSRSDRTA